MSRIVCTICLGLFLSLALAGNLSAQEDGSGIVFTGCPPFVEGSHCDSMFYQVVAVDIETGHPVTGVKYFLVEGLGTVNANSGLWVFHPESDELPPYYNGQVSIGAVHGRDSTTADEYCRFDLRVRDQRPRFDGYCGAHITVPPDSGITIPLVVTDRDACDTPSFTSAEISPTPDGQFQFDRDQNLLFFVPSRADAGQTFEVTVEATSGASEITCHFFLETGPPDPIRLSLEDTGRKVAQPGDLVQIDITLSALPHDLGQIDLMIGFDEAQLEYVNAIAGEALFSPLTGCGWERFSGGLARHVGTSDEPGMVRLRMAASLTPGPPDATCFRPDSLPAVIATLEFRVREDADPYASFIPISFYWNGCHDNLMVSADRNELYTPAAVFDQRRRRKPQPVPGWAGFGDDCYFYRYGTTERYRNIEMHNGGIRLSRPEEPMAYGVSIGRIKDQLQGQYVDVPLTLHQADTADPTNGFGGFDLVIAYEASALSFQMALEGDIYEECGWEYFTYRYGANGNCDGGCPSGMLRLIGSAETNNGPYHPGCNDSHVGYVETMPVTLATLRFLVSNDRTLECQFIPIRFLWLDCGDNALSNVDGSKLLLSEKVFDFYEYGRPFTGGELTGDSAFPTFVGTEATLELEECYIDDYNYGKSALPSVWYQNGGIDIQCAGTIDATGDINLNGLAYEIADAVMFANYFTQGMAAFPHPDGSIAASDVNKDGLPLTIEDYVYLVRVVFGEMLPGETPGEPSPNPAHFSLDTASSVVSVRSLDTLGAVNLILNGEVTPTLLADQMSMNYGWDSGWTRILIYSHESGVAITSGPLVSVAGAFSIVLANTATYDARPVESIIETGDDHARNPSLRIEAIHNQIQGQYVDISIDMEQDRRRPRPIGGFDLLISYDASALSIQKADAGEFFTECKWEYFTYRFGPYGNCDGGCCPSGVLRIIGLAESPSGDQALHPDCFVNDGTVTSATELATMTFLVSNDRTLACEFAPIKFTWYACSDNSLANVMGDTLLLANRVYDYVPLGAPPFPGMYVRVDSLSDNPFPNTTGITFKRDCLASTSIRTFDFFSGGIDIACSDTIPLGIGDINLNGIAYEIADAVMFADYFTQGHAAFGFPPDGSIAASDVNRDGITLTIEDYVYLVRVVQGSMTPGTPVEPSPNQSWFSWGPPNNTLSVRTADTLGAIHLILSGHVIPKPISPSMQLSYREFGPNTMILIQALEPGSFIPTGPLFTIMQPAQIFRVASATHDARQSRSVVGDITDLDDQSALLPAEFALRANYPNPFNPTTTIEYDLPRQAQVEIVVYNITGQAVRTLVNDVVEAGQHSVEWNGRNGSGQAVASGIYLYRIRAGDFVQTRKMLLLK